MASLDTQTQTLDGNQATVTIHADGWITLALPTGITRLSIEGADRLAGMLRTASAEAYTRHMSDRR